MWFLTAKGAGLRLNVGLSFPYVGLLENIRLAGVKFALYAFNDKVPGADLHFAFQRFYSKTVHVVNAHAFRHKSLYFLPVVAGKLYGFHGHGFFGVSCHKSSYLHSFNGQKSGRFLFLISIFFNARPHLYTVFQVSLSKKPFLKGQIVQHLGISISIFTVIVILCAAVPHVYGLGGCYASIRPPTSAFFTHHNCNMGRRINFRTAAKRARFQFRILHLAPRGIWAIESHKNNPVP